MTKTLLYITNGLSGSGGLERVVCLKASYFADTLNYDVHVIVLNEKEKTPYYDISSNVTLHNIDAKGNILKFYRRYISGVKRIINKTNPNVILVADDGLKGLYVPLLFKSSAKFIYERHTTKAINGSGLKARIINKLMDFDSKSFDRFVVLTERNKNDWMKASGLTVIPNPLPFPILHESVPENIHSRKKIISVGSMSYVKGHDILIMAWAEIHNKFPEYSLHIYGAEKDNYNYLKELITNNKLQHTVSLHHPEKDIRQRYLESAVCVLPSRVEGFGMVLIEAMACGTPCIATACVGPMDIVISGKNGIIVPVDNVGMMSDAIASLLTDKQILQQYSTAGLLTAKKYTIDHIMKQWDKLIN